MARDPSDPGPELLAFLAERHLATLTTLRPNGSPRRPGGVTYDAPTRTALVITSGASAAVRHVRDGGRQVAVCKLKDPRAPRPSQARAGTLHGGHTA